jgi:hypothetical protein
MEIIEQNKIILKEKYPDGIPDSLVYDLKRPFGETSRELWLSYLDEINLTEDGFDKLLMYKQFSIHCDYCHKFNIPHVED